MIESDSDLSVPRWQFPCVPRFGLRSLLLVAVVCCIVFAWTGRSLYRVRQEHAAVEALKRTEGKFEAMKGSVGLRFGWEEVQPFEDYSPLARWLGRGERPLLSRVTLQSRAAVDQNADAAVEALVAFPEIQYVHLIGPAFDDESLTCVARLHAVEGISLSNADVTAAGIAKLGSPLKVREVTFANGVPSAELIRAIASLPELESLALYENVPVDSKSYTSLEIASRLKILLATKSGFNDDSMLTIAKLENLEWIVVDDITDSGLARLAPLTKLRFLELKSPVTKPAAREFSATHPACRVVLIDIWGQKTTYFAGEVDM